MENYIAKLPVEIQQYIQKLVPEYTRLSKQHYVGENIFLKRCYSGITKKELQLYLNKVKVNNFIIYTNYPDEFVVDIFNLNIQNKYVISDAPSYTQMRCIIKLIRSTSFIDKFYIEIISTKVHSCISVNDIIEECDDYFYLDSINTYKIIKSMRKECDRLKLNNITDILSQDILNPSKCIRLYINNILHNSPIEIYDYSTIFYKLIKYIYVKTNYRLIFSDLNGIHNTFLDLSVNDMTFDGCGNLLSGDDFVHDINTYYDIYLEKLNGYADTYYY